MSKSDQQEASDDWIQIHNEEKIALAEKVVAFLNEAFKCDPKAIHALIEHRVPCNQDMADHPTIQVVRPVGSDTSTVGMLGIINGLVGVDESHWGFVAAVYDDDEKLTGFVIPKRNPKSS
jgi:hypothetical protein